MSGSKPKAKNYKPPKEPKEATASQLFDRYMQVYIQVRFWKLLIYDIEQGPVQVKLIILQSYL